MNIIEIVYILKSMMNILHSASKLEFPSGESVNHNEADRHSLLNEGVCLISIG